MKLLFSILLSSLWIFSFGQNFFLADFNDCLEDIICPYDSSQTIELSIEDWEIYQTLDGAWDGVIDSTQCITLDLDPISSSRKIKTRRLIINLMNLKPC